MERQTRKGLEEVGRSWKAELVEISRYQDRVGWVIWVIYVFPQMVSAFQGRTDSSYTPPGYVRGGRRPRLGRGLG